MCAIDTATQRSVTLYNPASSVVAGQGATVDIAGNGFFGGNSIQCLKARVGVTCLPSPGSPLPPAEAGLAGPFLLWNCCCSRLLSGAVQEGRKPDSQASASMTLTVE